MIREVDFDDKGDIFYSNQSTDTMSKHILETLFDSRLRVKVLKYLFRNIGANFSVRELATHVQDKPKAVRREINKLIDIGLIKIKKP